VRFDTVTNVPGQRWSWISVFAIARGLRDEKREQIKGLGREVDVPVIAGELALFQIEDAVAERHAHRRSGGNPGETRARSEDFRMLATDLQ
jgi:hypothetical protein